MKLTKEQVSSFAMTALDDYTNSLSDKQYKQFKDSGNYDKINNALQDDKLPKMSKVLKGNIDLINHRHNVDLDDRTEDLAELANMYYILDYKDTASRYELMAFAFGILSNQVQDVPDYLESYRKALLNYKTEDLKSISKSVFGNATVSTDKKLKVVKHDIHVLINSDDSSHLEKAVNQMAKELNVDAPVKLSELPD